MQARPHHCPLRQLQDIQRIIGKKETITQPQSIDWILQTHLLRQPAQPHFLWNRSRNHPQEEKNDPHPQKVVLKRSQRHAPSLIHLDHGQKIQLQRQSSPLLPLHLPQKDLKIQPSQRSSSHPKRKILVQKQIQRRKLSHWSRRRTTRRITGTFHLHLQRNVRTLQSCRQYLLPHVPRLQISRQQWTKLEHTRLLRTHTRIHHGTLRLHLHRK